MPAKPSSKAFRSMIAHSHSPTYLHGDDQGNIVCVSKSQRTPTREELIDGEMSIVWKTPTHRDVTGCWQYDEKYLTREEAEARVDAFLARYAELHDEPMAAD